MSRRVLALSLAAALLVGACSSDEAEPPEVSVLSNQSPTTSTSLAPTTTLEVEAGAAGSTTAPPSVAPAPPTTSEPGDGIVVDGTTATADTIYVGLLTDLTGPFSGNVVDVVDGQIAFWDALNRSGGIAGRKVELLIANTGYDIDTHVERYRDLQDRVVMFSHSTGSPHTAVIAPLLVADQRLTVPATWYSGWTDPLMGANVLEVGSNYCLEAMNTISYLAAEHQAATGQPMRLAIATNPGDYGQDSAAGARVAASQLGLEVVYNGEAALAGPDSIGAVAAGIAESGADWTWITTDPLTMASVVGGALQLGYPGKWSGAMPTFSPRLLDTALGAYLSESWLLSALYAPLGSEVEGMDTVLATLTEAYPDRYPSDGLMLGYLQYEAARQVLERAAELGDLTPAGVLAAAADLEQLSFGGIGPTNVYTGAPNDVVARETAVYQPDKALFDAQGGLEATFAQGAVSPFRPLQGFAASGVAAGYDFQRPCFELTMPEAG